MFLNITQIVFRFLFFLYNLITCSNIVVFQFNMNFFDSKKINVIIQYCDEQRTVKSFVDIL
jgi:hypothetical protein